jgi:uncharacterized metal-binding protein
MQYKEHCISNLIVGTLLVTVLASYEIPTTLRLIFASSFVLATFLLSPDLDLFHSSPSKNWGYMKAIWWPYSKIFKHRGLSHTPILGTWTRLGYIFAVFFLIFLAYDIFTHKNVDLSNLQMMASQRFEHTESYFEENRTVFISAFAGITASDFTHLVVDKISSFLKRL